METLWKISSKKNRQNLITNGNIYCSFPKFFWKKKRLTFTESLRDLCGILGFRAVSRLRNTGLQRRHFSTLGGLCRGYASDWLFGQRRPYVLFTSVEIINTVLNVNNSVISKTVLKFLHLHWYNGIVVIWRRGTNEKRTPVFRVYSL